MNILSALFRPQQKLLQQERELRSLRKQLNTLTEQNHSMKTGMRRCVSCEYRIDYKQRQQDNNSTLITSTPSE